MTVAEFIKLNTEQYHTEIETLMESDRMFQPEYSEGDYFKFLHVQFRFLQVFEDKIFAIIEKKWGDDMAWDLRKKLAILDQELKSHNYSLNADIQTYTSPITEYEALGILYVAEGSSLGGNIIRKTLAKNPSFQSHDFRFLNAYGDKTGYFWKEFTTFLNRHENHSDEILKGALIAYDTLIRIGKAVMKKENA